MEPEFSLPCLQKPADETYADNRRIYSNLCTLFP
jgi:hypothetical protein